MENPVRIHEVKRTIREGQALSVSLDELSIQISQLKTPARYAYCRFRQVDRRVMCASANKAFGLAAAPAPDFEDSQTPGPVKVHGGL